MNNNSEKSYELLLSYQKNAANMLFLETKTKRQQELDHNVTKQVDLFALKRLSKLKVGKWMLNGISIKLIFIQPSTIVKIHFIFLDFGEDHLIKKHEKNDEGTEFTCKKK